MGCDGSKNRGDSSFALCFCIHTPITAKAVAQIEIFYSSFTGFSTEFDETEVEEGEVSDDEIMDVKEEVVPELIDIKNLHFFI